MRTNPYSNICIQQNYALHEQVLFMHLCMKVSLAYHPIHWYCSMICVCGSSKLRASYSSLGNSQKYSITPYVILGSQNEANLPLGPATWKPPARIVQVNGNARDSWTYPYSLPWLLSGVDFFFSHIHFSTHPYLPEVPDFLAVFQRSGVGGLHLEMGRYMDRCMYVFLHWRLDRYEVEPVPHWLSYCKAGWCVICMC